MRRLAAGLLLLGGVAAQEPDVEGLQEFGGSARAREVLLKRGFVATDETRRQIFSFYVEHERIFVTTDCLLHAYHSNVEESLLALEALQSERLRMVLVRLRERLATLRFDGEESIERLVEAKGLDPAWREAAMAVDAYLSVAMTLLGGGSPPSEGPIAREIALILAAKGDAPSPLRGVTLDYGRFDPSGASLPLYHRAVTWLYDVPFRIGDDHETRQALVLAAIHDLEDQPSPKAIASVYHEFLGPGDDLDLDLYRDTYDRCIGDFATLAKEPARWTEARPALQRLPDPRHPTTPTADAVLDPARYKGLRFLSRPTLFDDDVFRILTPAGLERAPPSGEELMAALGSAVAEGIVSRREGASIPGYLALLARARARATETSPASVVVQAQRSLLRTLLEPQARADLPAYFLHPDWRCKELSTALSGWAHERFTWRSHTKASLYLTCEPGGSRGIIEPNEPFFGALLDLTVVTGAWFARHGVGKHRFAALAVLVAEVRVALRAQLEGRPPGDEQRVFDEFGPRLGALCGFGGNAWLFDKDLPDHTLAVPVARDVATGAQRWVGQAPPRAIYILAEHEGRRSIWVGGILSYRDHVETSEDEEVMTLDLWKKRAAADALPPSAWQRRLWE